MQLNFLIDECYRIKKDANSIISMLNYYIEKYVKPGISIILYMDNCPGQNKNRYLIGYLCYLTKVLKRHQEIQVYFMVVGHTKFSPDSHFGSIKKKIKSSECQSVLDLTGDLGLIRQSAINNIDITYKDPTTKQVNFEWKNWKAYLSPTFRECVGISGWHIVKIPSDSNLIHVSEGIGKEFKDYPIVEDNFTFNTQDKPNVIKPDGLTASRINELKYFERFVDQIHKPFMVLNDI